MFHESDISYNIITITTLQGIVHDFTLSILHEGKLFLLLIDILHNLRGPNKSHRD